MEDAVITHELAQLDYSKVASLQQKRTLAFINHFMLTTVQFLNTFISNCETKLQKFERKLQKVEASLIILETKLSSVPELDIETKILDPPHNTKELEPSNTTESLETETIGEPTFGETEDANAEESKIDIVKAEYERFIKMVQVGVPIDAVKLKITLEGLDPDCLAKYLHK